jgi:hypothetical protein
MTAAVSPLYAGGIFTTAGGAAANRIARWDGASWSPLGSGANDAVEALTVVFDDGGGAAPLRRAGAFTAARDSGVPRREMERRELVEPLVRDG